MVPMVYQCSRCRKLKPGVFTTFRGRVVCPSCKSEMIREEEKERQNRRRK